MKTVAVFGSTGSIGVQTLSVVRRFPKDYKIIALTAGNNVTLLKEQIREFSPDYVGANEKFSSGAKYEYFSDLSSLANDCDADIYVVAISGISALPPLINIIKKGRHLRCQRMYHFMHEPSGKTQADQKYFPHAFF